MIRFADLALTLGESLAGVSVIDLSRGLPGPYATYLLSSLGARVTSIERAETDELMGAAPQIYRMLREHKVQAHMDIKTEEGRQQVRELVVGGRADVVVESFRPGRAARIGLSYEDLSRDHRRLIGVSLTAYGLTGPLKDRAGLLGLGQDLVAAGLGGLLRPGDGTRVPPLPTSSLCAGLFCALSVTAALRQRERTGRGCHLDLGLSDLAAALGGMRLVLESDRGSDRHDELPACGVFHARDGRPFTIAALDQASFENLAFGIGQPGWVTSHPTLASRQQHAHEINRALQEIFVTRDRDVWLQMMAGRDVPAAPVHEPEELRTGHR